MGLLYIPEVVRVIEICMYHFMDEHFIQFLRCEIIGVRKHDFAFEYLRYAKENLNTAATVTQGPDPF